MEREYDGNEVLDGLICTEWKIKWGNFKGWNGLGIGKHSGAIVWECEKNGWTTFAKKGGEIISKWRMVVW